MCLGTQRTGPAWCGYCTCPVVWSLHEGMWCNLRNGSPMEVYLAQPRGFCAGVVRAIEIVERALAEIRPAGLCAARDRAQQVRGRKPEGEGRASSSRICPRCRHGAVTVFSAHGVARSVEEEAADARPARSSMPPARWSPRSTTRASATCRKGRALILIGHAGHPEVEGTMGQIPGPVHAGPERRRRRRRSTCRPTPRWPTSPRPRSASTTHKDIIAALQAPFYRYSRPGHPRYLLCDTEPPDPRCGT